MKQFLSIFLVAGMLISTSCMVVTPSSKRTGTSTSNGKKKGWFKNRHNPHNPNTDNPGKGNGKHKNKFTRMSFE